MSRTLGISVGRATAIMCFAFGAALIAAATQGFGETVDSRRPIGARTGTSPSSAGGTDIMWELILSGDHTFTGYIDSRRRGIVGVNGTWQTSGEGLSMRGTYTGGPLVMKGSPFTFELMRRGDSLKGTQYRAFQPTEIPISPARAK